MLRPRSGDGQPAGRQMLRRLSGAAADFQSGLAHPEIEVIVKLPEQLGRIGRSRPVVQFTHAGEFKLAAAVDGGHLFTFVVGYSLKQKVLR